MTYDEVWGPTYRVCDLIKKNKMRYPSVMKDLRAGRLRASKVAGAWRCKRDDWKKYLEWLWESGLNEPPKTVESGTVV